MTMKIWLFVLTFPHINTRHGAANISSIFNDLHAVQLDKNRQHTHVCFAGYHESQPHSL